MRSDSRGSSGYLADDDERRTYSTSRARETRCVLLQVFAFLLILAILGVAGYFLGLHLQPQFSGKVKLKGEGSSFAAPLYQTWASMYEKHTRKRLSIDYDVADSSQGYDKLLAQKVIFAGVDVPQVTSPSSKNVMLVPTVAGAVVIIYSLPPPFSGLEFRRETVVEIFTGNITSWNDSEIWSVPNNQAILNQVNQSDPDLVDELFNAPILPLHRTDASGTTYLLTNSMQQWNRGWIYGATMGWPVNASNIDNLNITTNAAMISAVQSNLYSVGYCGLADVYLANTTGALPPTFHIANFFLQFSNPANVTLRPNITTISAAVSNATLDPKTFTVTINTNCPACWPIAGFTYFMMLIDHNYADDDHYECDTTVLALEQFIHWAYASPEANRTAYEYNFIPYPCGSCSPILLYVDSLKCNGRPALKPPALFWQWIGIGIAVILTAALALCWCAFRTYRKRKLLENADVEARRRLLAEDKLRISSNPLLDNARIEQDELRLERRIGSGSFGDVYMGLWRGTAVAVKKMLYAEDEALMTAFMQEASLMSRLRHPNIVQFLGATISPPHVYIVTEFCTNGSLFDVLGIRRSGNSQRQRSARQTIGPLKRLDMLIDTARGMNYLHGARPPIIHRDLKPQNLLVTSEWTVKVADFGLSRTLDISGRTMTNVQGTIDYAAPEVLDSQKYSEKADVYSFAITIWQVFAGEDVWPAELGMFEVMKKVVSEDMRPPVNKVSAFMPEVVPLMQACWAKDPSQRPPFSEVLTRLEEIRQQISARNKKSGKPRSASTLDHAADFESTV